MLWQDLTALSHKNMEGRRTGTPGGLKARKFIISRFEELGIAKAISGTNHNSYEHPFKLNRLLGDSEGVNLVGKVKGTMFPEKYIILTAHYDHLGKMRGKVYAGANDNASGVAALLNIASRVANSPLQHSILFLATDYEEAGLYGSRAFVREAIVPHEDIILNYNLDMMGQPGKSGILYVTGTKLLPQYKPLVAKVAQQDGFCLKTGRDSPSRSFDRRYRIDWKKASDHYEFHKAGIPWLFIGVEDYKYYHTPMDTANNLSRSFFAAATNASWQLLVAIDQFHALH